MKEIKVYVRPAEAERFIEIIREHGRTGTRGDGRIFVSPIEGAVSIRTGERGEEAL